MMNSFSDFDSCIETKSAFTRLIEMQILVTLTLYFRAL